jgi:hypothetical protein
MRVYSESDLKQCKKCGSHTVVWQKSRKTGKFYLTEVFTDNTGDLVSDRRDFHSLYCGDAALHTAKQRELRQEADNAEAEWEAREEASAMESAQYFLDLHDLCKRDPEMAGRELGKRMARLDAIMDQPTSMDYMTEHMRELAEKKRLTAEISFMRAAMGEVDLED